MRERGRRESRHAHSRVKIILHSREVKSKSEMTQNNKNARAKTEPPPPPPLPPLKYIAFEISASALLVDTFLAVRTLYFKVLSSMKPLFVPNACSSARLAFALRSSSRSFILLSSCDGRNSIHFA